LGRPMAQRIPIQLHVANALQWLGTLYRNPAEGKLGDFDGDGDLDVLNKPYTWNAPRVDLWINGVKPPNP
jgi:hypothetical protein